MSREALSIFKIHRNLQCYVSYLKEEKPKVCRFFSCLPQVYKDKIEFGMPKTMDDAIRKSKLFFL